LTQGLLAHDPEKSKPVFGSDHALLKSLRAIGRKTGATFADRALRAD